MSNQKAQQITIPLASGINMNLNKAEIHNFESFNEKNGPIFGNCLSPLYYKSKGTSSTHYVVDTNGNEYTLTNGILYKNGVQIASFDTTGFVQETLTVDSDVVGIGINSDESAMSYIHKYSGGIVNISAGISNTSISIGVEPFYYKTLWTGLDECFFVMASITGTSTYSLTLVVYSGGTFNSSNISFTSTSISLNQPIINLYKYSSTYMLITLLDKSGGHTLPSNPTNFIYNIGTKTLTQATLTYTNTPTAPTTSSGYYTMCLPNAIYESGKVYATSHASWPEYDSSLAWGTYAYGWSMSGTISAVTDSIITISCDTSSMYCNYIVIGNGKTNTSSTKYTIEIPKAYQDGVDIGQGYFRHIMGGEWKINISGTIVSDIENINIVCDNTLDLPSHEITQGGYGTVTATGAMYNDTGASVSLGNGFHLLYNLGMLSGISYGSSRGTLLTEWNSVDTDFYIASSAKSVIYKDYNGKYIKLSTSTVNSFKLVEGNIIVVNTISDQNAYNINTSTLATYADDWNNRYYFGTPVTDTTVPAIVPATMNTGSTSVYVSAINANYSITGDQLCGAEWPVAYYNGVVNTYGSATYSCLASTNRPYVDLYFSSVTSSLTVSITAKYSKSVKYTNALISNINSILSGAEYPVATNGTIYYNPSIFTKYIVSNGGKDMININGNIYTLTYSGTTPYLLYSYTTQTNNTTATFIIQGQQYSVINDLLVSVDTTSGASNTSNIVSVYGMQYIGCSPTVAYFYSIMNRTIYTFTGDRQLSIWKAANSITEINYSSYNTATEGIYFGTNDGLYVIESNGDIFKLAIYNVEGIYYQQNSIAITTADNLIYISYYPQNGYSSNDIKMTTCYYGTGNNQTGIIDTWYIKLFNNNEPISGKVVVSISTLTNIGSSSESKTLNISPDMWDKLTNTLLIRYQPKYQKGVGASLSLDSSFPIESISLSYTPDTVEISKENI